MPIQYLDEEQGNAITPEVLKKPTVDPTFYSEGIAPFLEGANTAAFGAPKFIASRFMSPDKLKEAFPDQQTGIGKTLRFGAEAAGLIGGGPAKFGMMAAKGALKAAPKLMAKPLAQASVGGAAAGIATPAINQEDSLVERLKNAAGGAVAPGAIKVAGKIAGKLGAPISTIGKGIQNATLGNDVAAYSRANKFSTLENPEYQTKEVPQEIKKKLVDLFPNARNTTGQKLSNLINAKYKNVFAPVSQLKTGVDDALQGRNLDEWDITAGEKKTLSTIIDKVKTLGVFPSGASSDKAFEKAQDMPINKLWELRKDADKLTRNFPLRTDDAKFIWGKMRRALNDPIRTAGKDIGKHMDDYAFISDAEEALGKKFENVTDPRTGQVTSKGIQSLLRGILNDPETANLLMQVENRAKGSVMQSAMDYSAASKLANKESPASIVRIAEGLLQKPVVKASAGVQKLQGVGYKASKTAGKAKDAYLQYLNQ